MSVGTLVNNQPMSVGTLVNNQPMSVGTLVNNQPMSVRTLVNNQPMSDLYALIIDRCLTDVIDIGRTLGDTQTMC